MEYRDTMRRYASATSLPINKQPRHPRQRASEVGHASSRLSRMVNCAGLKGWKGGVRNVWDEGWRRIEHSVVTLVP